MTRITPIPGDNRVSGASGADFHRQLTIALEHLAIVGGLLAIATAGPGLARISHRFAGISGSHLFAQRIFRSSGIPECISE